VEAFRQHARRVPEECLGSEIVFTHCSTKWAVFLLSLKEVLETEQGKASPNDILI
jgi:hypothetical protein